MPLNQKEMLEASLYHIIRKQEFVDILKFGGVRTPETAPPTAATKIWNDSFLRKRSECILPLPTKPRLSEFVSFFATSRPPALFNIITGYGTDHQLKNRDLLLLRSSVGRLSQMLVPLVFADRQPLSAQVVWQAGNTGVEIFDWDIVLSGDFSTKRDPSRKARAGAEVLAHGTVPLASFTEVICSESEEEVRGMIASASIASMPVRRSSSHFFSQGA